MSDDANPLDVREIVIEERSCLAYHQALGLALQFLSQASGCDELPADMRPAVDQSIVILKSMRHVFAPLDEVPARFHSPPGTLAH